MTIALTAALQQLENFGENTPSPQQKVIHVTGELNEAEKEKTSSSYAVLESRVLQLEKQLKETESQLDKITNERNELLQKQISHRQETHHIVRRHFLSLSNPKETTTTEHHKEKTITPPKFESPEPKHKPAEKPAFSVPVATSPKLNHQKVVEEEIEEEPEYIEEEEPQQAEEEEDNFDEEKGTKS